MIYSLLRIGLSEIQPIFMAAALVLENAVNFLEFSIMKHMATLHNSQRLIKEMTVIPLQGFLNPTVV
jgi:hypothetical protein